MHMTRLNLYDVGIDYPRDWHIHVNPRIRIAYDEGMVRLENIGRKPLEAAVTLQWAPLEGFSSERYADTLFAALKKKFKSSFQALEHEPVRIAGHEALLLRFAYADNHGICKLGRRSQRIAEVQLMLPCAISERVLVVSFSCLENNLRDREEELLPLLRSAQCHAPDIKDVTDTLWRPAALLTGTES